MRLPSWTQERAPASSRRESRGNHSAIVWRRHEASQDLARSILTTAIAVLVPALSPASAGAAFPGANGEIAFTKNFNDVAVIDPAGGNSDLAIADAFDPVWSPDGRRI